MPIPRTLDIDPRSKSLKKFEIRFHPMIIFKRSAQCGQMYQTIVKINRMDEGHQPVFCGKAGAIMKSTSPNTKFIIVNLNRPIL